MRSRASPWDPSRIERHSPKLSARYLRLQRARTVSPRVAAACLRVCLSLRSSSKTCPYPYPVPILSPSGLTEPMRLVPQKGSRKRNIREPRARQKRNCLALQPPSNRPSLRTRFERRGVHSLRRPRCGCLEMSRHEEIPTANLASHAAERRGPRLDPLGERDTCTPPLAEKART